MNNKITEMAKDYLIKCEYTENGWQEVDDTRYEFDQEDLEKFIKLIVQECATVASDYDGAHYVGTAIEKHFGV